MRTFRAIRCLVHGWRHARNASLLISGFPWGPTNVPVNQAGLWARCGGQCALGFLNASRALYWFAHKPPTTWTLLHRAWERRCDGALRWDPSIHVAAAEQRLWAGNASKGHRGKEPLKRPGTPPAVPEGLLYWPTGPLFWVI